MTEGTSPAGAWSHAGSLSDRSLLAIGMSAMVAFVLFDAGARADWIDARFGLGGSVVAVVVFVATLACAHLDGRAALHVRAARRPRLPEATAHRRFHDDIHSPQEAST